MSEETRQITTKFNIGQLVFLEAALEGFCIKDLIRYQAGEIMFSPQKIVGINIDICYGGTQIFYIVRCLNLSPDKDLCRTSEPELISFYDALKALDIKAKELAK